MSHGRISRIFLAVWLCAVIGGCSSPGSSTGGNGDPGNGVPPVISSVSGTCQTGQTIVISGSDLVDEDKAHWAALFRSGTAYGFEGSTYLDDGYYAAPDANRFEPVYDTSVMIQGNQSYKGRIVGAFSGASYTNNASSGAFVDLQEAGFSDTSDLYIRLYSRWHSAGSISRWPDSHIKMLDYCCTGEQWYFQPDNSIDGTTLPTQMNLTYDSTPHNYDVADFLQNDRWYCTEVHWKTSAPAAYAAWVDGVQIASVSPASSGVADYMMFNMINLRGTGADFDLTNWTDALAISTSRIGCAARVEIGSGSDYGTATKKVQELLYFSDTELRIKADLTGLGSGPYYLWVTNNRQERSAAVQL
jgi:hypothetical protein